ncbi:MAG: hypothetical protein IJE23_04650 [Tyzzerella sp.]|nr:hypothetical protein [Tyzzerella sp.]
MKKRILGVLLVAAITLTGSLVMATSAKEQVDLAGYYTVEGANLQMTEDAINFVMTEEEATVTFNKPLASDNFQLIFAGVEDSSLAKAEFILADSENADEIVKIAYNRMSDVQTSVIVNDSNRSFITTGSLYKKNDGNFTVAYSATSNCFGDGMALNIPVLETIKGEGFLGFSSQKVNLTIHLYGEAGSVFCLKSINQQRMGTKYTVDKTAPLVSVVNPISYVVKNSEVILPTAFATDVLADEATVSMSVLDPDGEVVSASDGTKLKNVTPDKEYAITIEKYGTYRIEYKATDGTNETRSVVSRVNVVDETAPALKLKKTISSTTKVGDKLEFPEVTCSDNISEKENIKLSVTVKHPSGIVTAESKFVELTEEGVYEITFLAVDEAGNVGRLTVKTYAEGE